jgi:hypothetical protein
MARSAASDRSSHPRCARWCECTTRMPPGGRRHLRSVGRKAAVGLGLSHRRSGGPCDRDHGAAERAHPRWARDRSHSSL